MTTRSGRQLMSVPYPQELNDIPAIVARRTNMPDFADMIVDQFEEMRVQSAAQPLVMGIALHAYIVGQPHRLPHLRRALATSPRRAMRSGSAPPAQLPSTPPRCRPEPSRAAEQARRVRAAGDRMNEIVADLLRRRRAWHSLDQAFYTSADYLPRRHGTHLRAELDFRRPGAGRAGTRRRDGAARRRGADPDPAR